MKIIWYFPRQYIKLWYNVRNRQSFFNNSLKIGSNLVPWSQRNKEFFPVHVGETPSSKFCHLPCLWQFMGNKSFSFHIVNDRIIIILIHFLHNMTTSTIKEIKERNKFIRLIETLMRQQGLICMFYLLEMHQPPPFLHIMAELGWKVYLICVSKGQFRTRNLGHLHVIFHSVVQTNIKWRFVSSSCHSTTIKAIYPLVFLMEMPFSNEIDTNRCMKLEGLCVPYDIHVHVQHFFIYSTEKD